MIVALFLTLFPAPVFPAPSFAPTFQEAQDAEVDAKIAEAGNDVTKLMELAGTFATGGKDDAAKKVYKKVISIDPMHEAAHKALRHNFYDGKWFESYSELSKYRREETNKMKEKGLARWKDQWVPEADVPYLNMGWTKTESGTWENPVEVARNKQIEEWKAAGCTFRADDSSWIAPADNEKWSQGLWKCGDEWVDMAKANEFHSKLGQWWKLEGEHFVAWTTCEWDGGNWARWHADQTYPELVRIFGVEPAKKPHFIVLNSHAQYNEAAGGQPPVLPESEGFSSLHGAYFADGFLDQTVQPPQYLACGVSYWDRKDPKLDPWGPFWLRWAAAQSFCETIDPSWLAISEAFAAQASGGGGGGGTFWTEKKIPRWLRYGAASYVERYAKNPQASDGGNPWENREFAIGELKKTGGIRKLEDIFAFPLDLADIDGSGKLYHEAGLLVSYMLDGADGDKKLKEKHEAFKTALRGGKKEDVAKAVEELQKELASSEKDIKKFADL